MDKGKVLVIEDNKKNMKLIGAVLERKGNYKVLEASSAEAGIEIARKNKPDIILMDVHLPGMNGFEATRILKSDPTLKHIPVVAVTASDMLADEKKSHSAGCVGNICKPINIQSFIETMEDLVA